MRTPHIDELTLEQMAQLDALAWHVCGSPFIQAPTDWQRFALELLAKGVKWEIEQ